MQSVQTKWWEVGSSAEQGEGQRVGCRRGRWRTEESKKFFKLVIVGFSMFFQLVIEGFSTCLCLGLKGS